MQAEDLASTGREDRDKIVEKTMINDEIVKGETLNSSEQNSSEQDSSEKSLAEQDSLEAEKDASVQASPEVILRRSARIRDLREQKGLLASIDENFDEHAQIATEDPATLKEAMSSPKKQQWDLAMKEELESLLENNTWEVCETPADRNIVSCK